MSLRTSLLTKDVLHHPGYGVPNSSPSRSSFALARFMDTVQFYMNGYGFNYATGHDYPLGDDDPADRDNRPAGANYHPPEALW